MLKIFLLLIATTTLVTTFHQYRDVICKTKDGRNRGGAEKAKCSISLKSEEFDRGRSARVGDGCYVERLGRGKETREICDLVCPKAHTVFVAHIDIGHRACFNYYNYELIQQKDEWFLMRSGECANSTITFRIGCKFDSPFNETYANDEAVFAHLRARRSRGLRLF
ncbi:unnamed protein product, partial [Mesorhabditis belari]|uniref:DUF7808 domain-containing protein n=1 Tax=Mesorhabditis belari TaxID=2138241 RepID=A0AAF3J2Q3_9BILA